MNGAAVAVKILALEPEGIDHGIGLNIPAGIDREIDATCSARCCRRRMVARNGKIQTAKIGLDIAGNVRSGDGLIHDDRISGESRGGRCRNGRAYKQSVH